MARLPRPHFTHERRLLEAGPGPVAGIDEVGRGPLAGPVVAAACILDPERLPRGLRDSKLLTPQQREKLAAKISATCAAYSLAAVSAAVIDEIGILAATKRAMRFAVKRLSVPPGFLLIDALNINLPGTPQLGIIRGDASVLSIAAASILAKVHRDALMARWDAEFPGYGFAGHAGYGTPEHLEALDRLGPSPLHRQTFAPVRARSGRISIDIVTAPLSDPFPTA